MQSHLQVFYRLHLLSVFIGQIFLSLDKRIEFFFHCLISGLLYLRFSALNLPLLVLKIVKILVKRLSGQNLVISRLFLFFITGLSECGLPVRAV